jgi:hypothetical protein
MLIEYNFLELFTKFVKATESGRRVKQDGNRIAPSAITNYYNVLRLLKNFEKKKEVTLRV